MALDASTYSPYRARPDDVGATELHGYVERLFAQKPNWCAGTVRTASGLCKFSVRGFVSEKDTVTLKGQWANSDKWGWEFSAASVAHSVPVSRDGIVKWLAWNAKNVGEKKAAKLYDRFGADLFAVLVSDPGTVAAFAGVDVQHIQAVGKMWKLYENRIRTIAALADVGLTSAQCDAVERKYGTSSVGVLRANPYQLVGEVDGIGWKRADEIAASIGIVGNDPRRLRGGIGALVREEYARGHTVTPVAAAVGRAAALLGAPPELVGAEVPFAVRPGSLERVRDGLATPWAVRCERYLWEFFAGAREPAPIRACPVGDEARYAALYRQCGALELDDEQLKAVQNAVTYRISTLTGSAGSGKSSCSRAVIKAYHSRGFRVHLAAPTGKAARRLSEIIGMQGQTIHRLLGWNGRERRFMHNESTPLSGGLYLIDEVSMGCTTLMYSLMSAMPADAVVVLVGDVQQLPPVGPGAVLRDIIAHDLVPTTRLVQCHRHAGVLKRNCTALLSGVVMPTEPDAADPPPWVVFDGLDTDDKVLRAVWTTHRDLLPKWGYGGDDWVFLAPKLDGPLGVKRLNIALQYLCQTAAGVTIPKPLPDDWQRRAILYPGDRVLMTVNNYNLGTDGIMNGTVGRVVRVNPLVVRYEGEDEPVEHSASAEQAVQLAYCLTPHRFQGSQIPCAVVVVPKGCHGFAGRSWLYTAASRAMRTAVMLGDGETMQRAALRTDEENRRTLLGMFATEGYQ